MSATEMLEKMLESSGWVITEETDEDGYRIVKENNNG